MSAAGTFTSKTSESWIYSLPEQIVPGLKVQAAAATPKRNREPTVRNPKCAGERCMFDLLVHLHCTEINFSYYSTIYMIEAE
jgi:hypothetical protein